MKQSDRASTFLRQIHTFPLSALRLARSLRLLIVTLSYGLGVPGLWFFFPRVHNGASILLPIICACWLFRYRGLVVSLVLNVIAMCLVFFLLLRHLLSDGAFVERVAVGSGISLGLGLVICWLRTAVDLMHLARQMAQAAEQERLQAEHAERLVTLAYEQQCEINELKDQFLLNVSHELRTPLTVLGGSLELLGLHYERLSPMERAHVLKRALASQEQLVDLVNRVLDAAMVVSEIPQVKSQVVYVHRFLAEVLAQLEHDQAYTICLQVPEEVMVWADPQLLRQVLRNLLSNVFKYVPRQTEIRIETTHADPSSPVCLSVQDAGPGIPAEELPLLFEKFVRLKRDLAGTTRGTGLGLYICKRLVEAMGGCIWVESSGRLGEGSRFCVTLPPFSPP
jgi:signal transduction histidine kinase